MIPALVVFLSMTCQDCLNAVYVLLLARHKIIAGIADGTQDVAQVFAIGVGGVTILRHPLSATSALVVVAIYSGSILGADLGGRLCARFKQAPSYSDPE